MNKTAYRNSHHYFLLLEPPSENPKTERLFIRVTPSDKKDIQEFSDETGYSLLDLLKIGVETVKKK